MNKHKRGTPSYLHATIYKALMSHFAFKRVKIDPKCEFERHINVSVLYLPRLSDGKVQTCLNLGSEWYHHYLRP